MVVGGQPAKKSPLCAGNRRLLTYAANCIDLWHAVLLQYLTHWLDAGGRDKSIRPQFIIYSLHLYKEACNTYIAFYHLSFKYRTYYYSHKAEKQKCIMINSNALAHIHIPVFAAAIASLWKTQ